MPCFPAIRERSLRRRSGMTLVELLTVCVIIGILASIMLFALSGAQQTARVAKTKQTIAKLDRLIMERWNSYQTRRIPWDLYADTSFGTNTVALNRKKLDLLRLLMSLEMPDKWEEVSRWNLGDDSSNNWQTPLALPFDFQTALFTALRNHRDTARANLAAMNSTDFSNKFGVAQNDTNIDQLIRLNQGAECLYAIVIYGCGEGGALELFSSSEIGDKDGDGLPEFLDGWGNPISYIRWPAGFVDGRQPVSFSSERQPSNNPMSDHDPFDPNRTDTTAYRLSPLIYSAGPDGDFDVVAPTDTGTLYYNNPATATNWYSSQLNPYVNIASGRAMGTFYNPNSNVFSQWRCWDNIYNHPTYSQ